MPTDSIGVNFDSSLRARIVNGVAKFHKYSALVPQGPGIMGPLIPNPETKTQFAQRMFAEQVMAWVVAAEEADDHAALPRRVKPPIT